MNTRNLEAIEKETYKFSIRIFISICLVITLTIISDFTLTYLQSDYDYLINISGRQRMLSQRLALLKEIKGASSSEFREIKELFLKSHQDILKLASKGQQDFYKKNLNSQIYNYLSLLSNDKTSKIEISTHSSDILNKLNQAVTNFENESKYLHKIQLASEMALFIIGIFLAYSLYIKVLIPNNKKILSYLSLYHKEKIKADQSTKIKSTFLANMTHELRTPLNGVIGLTDLLIESQPTKKQLEYLKSLKFSGESLLELINEILDISKIESGKLKIVKIDMNLIETLEMIKSLLHPRAIEKGLYLDMIISKDLPEYVHTDPIRLKQILMNLITNAIKFTKEGGVSINVNSDGENLKISIKDTGIGIKEEDLELIFEEFQQIENSYVKNQEGTGLGLTLVKKIIDMLKGSLKVSSVLNKGTTFDIIIPFANVKESIIDEKDDKKQEITLSHKPKKILIAEDNKVNQLVISQLMKKLGLDFHIVNNGKEALEEVSSHFYDLVLMDISMPVMNGFQASQKIRDFNKDIVIICLSANVFEDDKIKASTAGMNDFLEKPIKLERLVSVINKNFNRTDSINLVS